MGTGMREESADVADGNMRRRIGERRGNVRDEGERVTVCAGATAAAASACCRVPASSSSSFACFMLHLSLGERFIHSKSRYMRTAQCTAQHMIHCGGSVWKKEKFKAKERERFCSILMSRFLMMIMMEKKKYTVHGTDSRKNSYSRFFAAGQTLFSLSLTLISSRDRMQ